MMKVDRTERTMGPSRLSEEGNLGSDLGSGSGSGSGLEIGRGSGKGSGKGGYPPRRARTRSTEKQQDQEFPSYPARYPPSSLPLAPPSPLSLNSPLSVDLSDTEVGSPSSPPPIPTMSSSSNSGGTGNPLLPLFRFGRPGLPGTSSHNHDKESSSFIHTNGSTLVGEASSTSKNNSNNNNNSASDGRSNVIGNPKPIQPPLLSSPSPLPSFSRDRIIPSLAIGGRNRGRWASTTTSSPSPRDSVIPHPLSHSDSRGNDMDDVDNRKSHAGQLDSNPLGVGSTFTPIPDRDRERDRRRSPLSQTLAPRKALELRGEIPIEPSSGPRLNVNPNSKKHRVRSSLQLQHHVVREGSTGKDRQEKNSTIPLDASTSIGNNDVDDDPALPARTGAALPVVRQPAYVPDPPMTFADRRRAESSLASGSGSGSSTANTLETGQRRARGRFGGRDGGRGTAGSLGGKLRHGDAWGWKRSVEGGNGTGSGSRGLSGEASIGDRGGATSTSLSPQTRRRGEIEETDAERKRREMESVINWKVWAAACVASNAIPVDNDPFRSTSQYPPRPRSRPRPRLAVHTNGARPMFDSSSTISTEDHIISPNMDEGTSWSASGVAIRSSRGPIAALAGQKRPLSHSTSMGELQAIKESHRNQSLPDIIVIEGERDTTSRRSAGKVTPIRSSAGSRTSSLLNPSSGGSSMLTSIPGPTNALLVLRPRLSNKNVRGIVLELVHALSSYLELRTCLDMAEQGVAGTEKKPVPSRSAWSRSALNAAREKGLLDDATLQEAHFQEGETVALFRDLDETIGYPGYVEKMLMKAGYGVHDVVFPRNDSNSHDNQRQLALEQCDKMLLDLEDLLWGRSEPLPDDIAYGHLILPTGKVDTRLSDQGPEPISSSLFDILAEPVPDTVADTDPNEFAKPFGATMRKPSLFTEGPNSRHNSVMYIPGVSTIDIASFIMPSSGRSSVDPHEATAGRSARRESTVKVKTAEDLAREGRERYEAWQKSREVQPLKRP